jgi:Na+/proline symporter
MVVGMALVPLCYTSFSGLRTSVFTDALQYGVIAMATATLLICFPGSFGRINPHQLSPLNPNLLWEFGISSGLGLIVAIFADHQQWQRVFAIHKMQIVPTFYKAAVMHGFVTVCLGTLGSLIYATGFQPIRIDLVGFEYVQTNYSPLFTPLFVVMVLCALTSTLDSALCAFASLAVKELPVGRPSLQNGRMWMMLLATSGALIGVFRPSLLTLWFVASTIRLSVFFPTICSIVNLGITNRLYAKATLAGIICGGGIFTLGLASGDSHTRTIGMVITLAVPGVILSLAHLLYCGLQPAIVNASPASAEAKSNQWPT